MGGGGAPQPGLGGSGRERPGPLPSPPEFAAGRPGRRGARAPRLVPARACQPLAPPPQAAGAPPGRAAGWVAGRAANFEPALTSAAWRGGRAAGRAPNPAGPRSAPAFPPRAPSAARGPRSAERVKLRRRLAGDSRRPLLDAVLRETSSVGFCSFAVESSGYAEPGSERLNLLPSDLLTPVLRLQRRPGRESLPGANALGGWSFFRPQVPPS